MLKQCHMHRAFELMRLKRGNRTQCCVQQTVYYTRDLSHWFHTTSHPALFIPCLLYETARS